MAQNKGAIVHPKKEATHLDHFLFPCIRLCMADHRFFTPVYSS